MGIPKSDLLDVNVALIHVGAQRNLHYCEIRVLEVGYGK